MKALAAVPSERRIRIVDHPEPALERPSQVLLRPLDVGVCGTDKEIARFAYGAPPEGDDYLVVGHEALCEVLEAGPNASGLAPGRLAVPMVRRPCPHAHCVACRRGSQDFCYTGDFTERGINGAHGFLTELVVEEARYVVPVPDALREVGVLIEPLSIAEKALIQVWDVQERLPWECRDARASGDAPKLRALVLGAGPVGLLGAMTATHAGFETTVYSREAPRSAKAKLVESIGARYVSARECDARDLAGTVGTIDFVYEAVGASALAFEVLRVMGPNAVFVFTGVPGRKAPIEIDASRLMRDIVLENQVLIGTVNAGRHAFEAAIRDLDAFREKWPEAVGALVSGRHPMERFDDLVSGKAKGIKNVVSPALEEERA